MAADADDDRIELTELDVITRYSLAVRSATADRDELIATFRSDLAWLESRPGRPRRARPSGTAAAKKATPGRIRPASR